jgi:beta-glucosidase
MKMWETFVKKQVFKAITGDLKVSNESLATMFESVEDTDFMGREDGHLPAEQRADAILAAMTLEETIAFAGGYTKMAIRAVPRLGLPSIWCSDATSGLRCFPGGTAFPAGVAMAATWDPELIEQVGAAIAEEFRAKGISILLGPGVNIYRVPTCGRNFEYMGEDPYLAGKMAAAYIRGAQARGVITTVKHLAANNSDYDRHKTDSVVDKRILHEIYLEAFRMAVQEGGSLGVMSSYNPVNGVYASENEYLLKTVLREQWGFEGFVISDWNSVYSTAPAVQNGLNLEMPSGKWISEARVKQAMAAGELAEEDLDAMLQPLLRTLFRAGVYDRPQVDREARMHSQDQIELSQRAAEGAITLLKNEGGLLPLDMPASSRIVVMGRTVDPTPTGGGGSSYLHRPGSPSVLDGIRAAFTDCEIVHQPFNKGKLTQAEAETIRAADVVVLAAGFYTWEETECFDRAWALPDGQGDLIQRVGRLNPNTVVVLTCGGGVETESWVHAVRAVVHGYYLGETAGTAIARVLRGEAEPGGRLPFSMVKRWEDLEATKYYVDRPETVRLRRIHGGQGDPTRRKVWPMVYGEGLRVGYRHLDSARIEPQFAFGHGLGYTSIVIESVVVEMTDRAASVQVKVRNTGERAGSAVVQVYVRDVEASVFRPEKELKAFGKAFVEGGGTAEMTLRLEERAFAFYDPEAGSWRVEAGEFEVLVGLSSREIVWREKVKVI